VLKEDAGGAYLLCADIVEGDHLSEKVNGVASRILVVRGEEDGD
jgi:hypothetical protein